jgi:hypothetical protein
MPSPDDRRGDGPPRRAPVSPRSTAPTPGRVAAPAEPPNRRRALAALLISLLSVAGLLSLNYLQRGVYLAAYALLAGLIAMWLAVTALARARRGGTALPRGSVVATIIAAIGIIFSAVMLLAFALLGPQLTAYGRCLNAASTPSDQRACQSQFIHAVDRQIAVLRKSGSG